MDALENIGGIRLVNLKSRPYPAYDEYIGRGNKWLGLRESKWHNPFILKREAERDAILAKHMEYMLTSPALIAALPELRGKILACYCVPRKCHGHNLIDLYNRFVDVNGKLKMDEYNAWLASL